MGKQKIKSYRIVLVAVLCLFLINFSIIAKGATYEEYEYQLVNNGTEIEIIGYSGQGGDITIPSEIEGKPVVGIKSETFYNRGVFYNKNIKSLVLPNTLKYIGDNAFLNNQLTNIDLPEGLVSIGDSAFGENQLISIEIPASVTSLSGFDDNQLTSIILPEGLKDIGKYAFRNNQLVSVEIPDSVTSIGDFAFYSNKLTSVDLSENLINIGVFAFGSNQLTSLDLPKRLVYISDFAFSFNKLFNIRIPESVVSIGEGSFRSNQITSIKLLEGITYIGENAFNNNKLNNIIIPGSVIFMGNDIFSGNPENFTIYGEPGSRAESYAGTFQHNFKSLPFIKVESIKLNKSELILPLRTTETLVATVLPEDASDKNLNWTSSEPGIVRVDETGLLTARREGEAVITVRTTDGNHMANCTVIVGDSTRKVEAIELNKFEIVLSPGSTETLIATVLPEDAWDKNLDWMSSNSSVAKVTRDGTVTGIREGEATITVSTRDGNHTASCRVVVKDIDWHIWESKYNVEIDHTWTVELNKSLDINTIKEKNIYITDRYGQTIPMFYYQEQQDIDKFIYIIPVKDYESGHTYTLWIRDLKAQDGSILNKNVKMDFKIR